jgi:hypothetical protein
MRRWWARPWLLGLALLLLLLQGAADMALAHGVQNKDAAFVAASSGPQPIAFLYLGAKHMVTGYDHLLFLLGVIFFLRRMKDVALYVSLFSLGHSITLLAGVLGKIHVNPFLVDAVIGLSVAYKAFDNLGGFRTTLGFQPDARVAVLGFGLIHGFGLATKLQVLELSPSGLLVNLIAFNVGVELGQLLALAVILGGVVAWHARPNFNRQAILANGALMSAGFLLVAYQLAGFFLKEGA